MKMDEIFLITNRKTPSEACLYLEECRISHAPAHWVDVTLTAKAVEILMRAALHLETSGEDFAAAGLRAILEGLKSSPHRQVNP